MGEAFLPRTPYYFPGKCKVDVSTQGRSLSLWCQNNISRMGDNCHPVKRKRQGLNLHAHEAQPR
jgi:hypothetical protein